MARTGTLASSTGESIFYRVWEPSASPAAVMVLVHGMSEHSGRYDHVGRYLSERGVIVYAHDHLGHGQSGGARGTVGRFEDFLDDLALVHAMARRDHPDLPLFMLGHSMGGLIVAAYLVERRARPDYLILSGPAIVPILEPGDRTIDPSRLSKDPAVWEQYMSDPLVLRERVTDDLFVRLADGLARLPGRAAEIDMPWLLIHGEADRLCSAEGARGWLEGSSSTQRTVRIYPGGRHEMLNETNKDEVLADAWKWMRARLE